ncbi:Cysteine desulfurase [hydrothermal vent metagenome]|uniref:Cysteine desulfurase n=1 Tax=hydrothermal vent metagenome TaxID=652676 RepID=A0A3B1BXC4_9ZZZZ
MLVSRLFEDDESVSIRESFPALTAMTFLNAAGMTPLATPGRDAMVALLNETSQSAYLKMDEWLERSKQAREASAGLIGASDREIAFVRNTSDGVSLVASGLGLKSGDEVILNDLEFPSNVYPWLNLQRLGVVVNTVKNEDGRVTIDSIAKAITPRTKIVAISSVQYLSGHRTDLDALGALTRDKNVLFFVDAIQSLGAIPLNVKRSGIDFLSCGGFKWLCGPMGSGIFFCDEKRLDDLELVRVGWNSVIDGEDFSNIDMTFKDDARRFEEGSPNLAGIYGLHESIKLVMSMGVERNEAHIIALTDRLIEGLESKNCQIFSPRGEGEKSGIVIFAPSDESKTDELSKRLADNKVIVIKRGKGIRVSPHFYNTASDIDRLLDFV